MKFHALYNLFIGMGLHLIIRAKEQTDCDCIEDLEKEKVVIIDTERKIRYNNCANSRRNIYETTRDINDKKHTR